jgi:hypothetical protein
VHYLIGFVRFWYDFIVGDDWTIAVAVAFTLGLLLILQRTTDGAWWLLPAVVALVLGASVWRAARGSGFDAP